jgi:[CysO sulfur-carrier protein]-S-L-cysteine hydrolase
VVGEGTEGTVSAHPGPLVTAIPRSIVDDMIDHARAEYPNEACGLVIGDRPAGEGGQALRFSPTANRAASPYRYEIHPDDLLRLTIEVEDEDQAFWAIVHSHVKSPAVPSPTDIGLAFYPEALYILVSLDAAHAHPVTGEPGVRAWRILDGLVHEVALQVGA